MKKKFRIMKDKNDVYFIQQRCFGFWFNCSYDGSFFEGVSTHYNLEAMEKRVKEWTKKNVYTVVKEYPTTTTKEKPNANVKVGV